MHITNSFNAFMKSTYNKNDYDFDNDFACNPWYDTEDYSDYTAEENTLSYDRCDDDSDPSRDTCSHTFHAVTERHAIRFYNHLSQLGYERMRLRGTGRYSIAVFGLSKEEAHALDEAFKSLGNLKPIGESLNAA